MAAITLSVGSGAYKYQFRITYSISQSAANNTSTISVDGVEFKTGGNYTTGSYNTTFKELKIYFAGVRISYASSGHAYAPVRNADTWYTITGATYDQGSGTITHNADGTKSGKFSLSTTLSATGWGPGDLSMESSDVNLPDITRIFTVSYDKGAYGTGTNSTDTKTYNVPLTLKGAEFTRVGYGYRLLFASANASNT